MTEKRIPRPRPAKAGRGHPFYKKGNYEETYCDGSGDWVGPVRADVPNDIGTTSNGTGFGAGGAGVGADISNFLLSTDVTEAYFIEQTSVDIQELDRILNDEWDDLDISNIYSSPELTLTMDIIRKREAGYMVSEAEGMDYIEYKILFELKRLGVEKYREDGKTPNIQIRSAPGGYRN